MGHSKGSVTSKYIRAMDTDHVMAMANIAGCFQGRIEGIKFFGSSCKRVGKLLRRNVITD